ncbi:MAG TPA: 3-keto-5-aminohexanoate cleavage protein [Streptosporangiaceae bacterium]|jgi:uncharacterized protein (DUF849 family)
MLIKACLNGGTTRDQHPAVPRTPGELAADAQDAVRAGAHVIHMHPRDAAGAETLEADAVLAAVRAVRAAVPGIPVGVTTGLWAVGGDPERRLALVAGWAGTERPDFATVNLCEPGPDALAASLASAGIEVEAGVWTPGDAERLAASEFATKAIRAVVEPRDDAPEAAEATAAAIDEVLDRHGLDLPRVHHGYGMATWQVIRAALRHGRDIRIGLEDTTVLPDGSTAAGNAGLVAAAVRLATEAGRQI